MEFHADADVEGATFIDMDQKFRYIRFEDLLEL